VIQVTDLVKTFEGTHGEVRALRGVSFEVGKGQLFTLLGPSGCGKTTTLRCIAGLEAPHEGEVRVNDRSVFSASDRIFVPPERRRIGMVFQSYAIWPHMTVFQNVAYPIAREVNRKELVRRVDNVLERLGLSHLRDRLAPNLSGGQQQRVALARALVAEPEILLLDEPLSNLDAKLREQMRFELKSLHDALDITTVYVTHDQEEALALSDQIGLMVDGELIEIGAPMHLYMHPEHRITADFLGTANFIPAQIREVGSTVSGEVCVESALGSFIGRCSARGLTGMAVELFFRPENVEVSTANRGKQDDLNCASGLVERVTFLGSSVDMLFRCGDVSVRVRAHPGRTPHPGDQVHFTVAPDSCIVFPSSHG